MPISILSDRERMELDNQRLTRLLRESVARETDRCEEVNELQERVGSLQRQLRGPQSLDEVIHPITER